MPSDENDDFWAPREETAALRGGVVGYLNILRVFISFLVFVCLLTVIQYATAYMFSSDLRPFSHNSCTCLLVGMRSISIGLWYHFR